MTFQGGSPDDDMELASKAAPGSGTYMALVGSCPLLHWALHPLTAQKLMMYSETTLLHNALSTPRLQVSPPVN